MEIDPQASLKENMVVTIFDQLEPERQRILLERFKKVLKKNNTHLQLAEGRESKFFSFLVKKWPYASSQFFKKAYQIWDLLSIFSRGNGALSTCDVGDFYLQAQLSKKNDLCFRPFGSSSDKEELFWTEALEEGRWDYFKMCRYVKGEENMEQYKIVDLMELEQPELDQKLSHFGYPTIQTSLEWNSGLARYFAELTGCIDKEIFSKFERRLAQISALSISYNRIPSPGGFLVMPLYVLVMHENCLALGEPQHPNHVEWANEVLSYPAIRFFETEPLLLVGSEKVSAEFFALLTQRDELYYLALSKMTEKSIEELQADF